MTAPINTAEVERLIGARTLDTVLLRHLGQPLRQELRGRFAVMSQSCSMRTMPMVDTEILELAAKAAGFKKWKRGNGGEFYVSANANWADGFADWRVWNPRTNDGDALRLAVALRINVSHFDALETVMAQRIGTTINATEGYGSDVGAAVRRAIVRVAAETAKHREASND